MTSPFQSETNGHDPVEAKRRELQRKQLKRKDLVRRDGRIAMTSESEAAVKSSEPNQPLKTLGKYLIERKLGQGGMGTVYLAKHTDLKKMIALKVLPRDKAKNPILVRRFKAEAQAAAQLEHPNIVAVFDTGEIDGYLYIAMEYVEGIDLYEQVKHGGPIPVKRSIEIIKQVASALQHAFEQNIVHRDIKPSNLLLRHDGTVKVTDLGLARSIDDTLETNITRAGTTVGTVDYMAPEQARSSKAADVRSDIYSLGCTWYQMLTGEPPYSEGSMTNKLQAHAIKPLPDPREINDKVPEGLFAVLQRMTAKKPEDRYQTPQELLDDLNNSKLTKAAFSNEIFDDLSDYDVDAIDDYDEDAEVDKDVKTRPQGKAPDRKSRRREQDERDNDDEPLDRKIPKKNRNRGGAGSDAVTGDELPVDPGRKRSRSRVSDDEHIDDDDDTPARKPVRNGSRPPIDETHQQYDQDDNAGNDVDREGLSEPTRRKTSARSSDDDDGSSPRSIRHKSKNRDEETSPAEDTQPLTTRRKPALKSDDDDHDDGSSRPARRSGSAARDEDSDDSTPSKRKTSSSGSGEGTSRSSKNGKSASGKESSAKGGEKHAPKPLPPKRQPVPLADEKRQQNSLELLKYAAIAAGVMATIGGIGWLVISWSSQVQSANNPFDIKKGTPQPDAVATATNNAAVTKTADPKSTDISVHVDDPAKSAATERATPNEYDITKLPAWVSTDAPEPRDLPFISVGPGATTPTHFSKLDDGLREADRAGGMIRLIGNGPFHLSNIKLGNAKRLVIAAATTQDQPLIIVAPAEAGAACGLTVNGGILDLRGLHFVYTRSADQNPASSAMISVVDGQLLVRNCSFTATGTDSASATALAFTSNQDSQNVPSIAPQVFIDRVTIRGNGLTGLQVARTTSEVVIQDSLFVTGTAPAIDLSGNLIAGLSEMADTKPRRTVRVLRSTFCARNRAVELASDNSGKPPSTSILFQDSICSAEGAGNTAVLVSATRWPSVTSTSTGWLTNLNWTSKSSLYIGFERLLDLDKSSFKVEGPDAWQRVWGKKFDLAQFQSIVWQESLFSDLGSVLPHDFETGKLPFRDLTTSKGTLPGCTTSQLVVPGVTSQLRLQAMSRRPKLPPDLPNSTDPKLTRKVNLAKEDLGAILNRNDWLDGTVFEVSGTGLQTMLPAKIKEKSVRIVFKSGDGPQLKLQPKILNEFKANPDTPGLFTVENGQLEMHSALIEASQSTRGSPPPWLIHSRNSTVILRGCLLGGPAAQELESHQGLIAWSTTTAKPPATAVEPEYLSLSDSLLMSSGTGIRFQTASGRLFLRNCIVAIRGNGLDLQPFRTDASLLPTVDLQHVTFSTSKAAIRIEAATGSDEIVSPMQIFTDFSAIVQPLEIKPGDADQSTVIDCAGPVLAQKQIEWWGHSNGFAKELKSLIRQSDASPLTSVEQWHKTWGEASDYRLLTGSKGIQLGSSLPNKWTNMKATSFLLSPNSIGATWADNGRPVGADIRAIEETFLAKKGTPDMKTGSTTTPPKPGTGTQPPPNTKKNIGF